MAKQRTKKKRNKTYRGIDAAVDPARPTIHRYSAVQRSAPRQWWHDHKRGIRIGGIAAAVTGFITWMIAEIVRLSMGG